MEGNGLNLEGTIFDNTERLEAQQTLKENFISGVKSTAAAAGVRRVQDEAGDLRAAMPEVNFEEDDGLLETGFKFAIEGGFQAMAGATALVGVTANDDTYEKSEHYDRLTEGVPYKYHNDIMGHDSLASAERARARIFEDLERGTKLSQQFGAGSDLAMMAGTVIDVDLPLTMMTGGAMKAARVARAGKRLKAIEGVKYGTIDGAVSGAAVSLGEEIWRETADWTTLAENMLTATVMGATIGGATNSRFANDEEGSIKIPQFLQKGVDELVDRVRRDDPTLKGDGLEAEKLRTDPIDFDELDLSRAAENVEGDVPVDRTTVDLTRSEADFTSMATNWRMNSGWHNQKKADIDTFLGKFVTNGPGKVMAMDYAKIYSSQAPSLNYLAGAIFESPHGYGRGRSTAATLQEHYQKQAVAPIKAAETELYQWAKKNNKTLASSGYGASDNGQRAFNREIMLEINARRQGRQYSNDPHVKKAADAYGEAGEAVLRNAKGRDGQKAVDGFQDVESGPYLPYRWNGRKLRDLIKKGTVSEASLINDLASAYRSAGMGIGRDAEAISKAVVTRMLSKADNMNTSMRDLMTRDGRDFLNEILKDSGLSEQNRLGIMDRMTGTKDEAGKSSHAKSRNEINLEGGITTNDGSTLQIVDLMDDDLHSSWQRYSRHMSGASALARQGLTNRSMRETLISAARKEQAALGEAPMDPNLIRAMFSHFDGGPIFGYSMGKTTEGIGVAPAIAKRTTSLALLGKLGIPQLGETGAQMAALGLSNWAERGVMSRLDPEKLRANRALLDDLSFVTGRIGEDHRHFAPHLELDTMSNVDGHEFTANLQKWLGKAQYIQGYTSLFNTVRSWQQTTVAMGMADKVSKAVRDSDTKKFDRITKDFGLSSDQITEIKKLIDSGVIQFSSNGKHVNRLNMDQWPVALADDFGSGITRSVNQQVQKSMAGEQDAWMNGEMASMLMHLKTFPLQAVSKQATRHMRFADTEGMGVLGYGMATAFLAVSLRHAIDGRNSTTQERAMQAIGYSNMTGFVPMVHDPLMTMLGLEDYRFNQYGPHSETSIPALDVGNKLMRVPGALADVVTGGDNGYDRQAIMTIPFMNSIGLSRMMQ